MKNWEEKNNLIIHTASSNKGDLLNLISENDEAYSHTAEQIINDAKSKYGNLLLVDTDLKGDKILLYFQQM